MATLVKEISITEFRKLKAHQLKRLKSAEIYSDGEYLFTFVNANTDYCRLSAETLSQLSNSVGGEELEDIVRENVTEEVRHDSL